jgi:crotonobetainyl-CoA:carnitine CoA-transferase CaiB-like acyl-CoA transferase
LTGHAEVLKDPRFSSIGNRTENIDELYGIVGEILRERTSAQWLGLLEAHDIPAMPMHSLESLVEDPHLADVDFFEMHNHPSEGRIRMMRAPTRFSGTPLRHLRHAPRLGEHTQEVLQEIGLQPAEISSACTVAK